MQFLQCYYLFSTLPQSKATVLQSRAVFSTMYQAPNPNLVKG
jgi:hypothetical protein